MQFSPKDLEQAKLQALAEVERRRREGLWSGGVRAHEEYQHRPLEWIVEKLGVPEETLRWSMHPEFANHSWDGDKDPLITILQALAEWKDCGCESATGTGKTFVAACVTLWFLAAHRDSLVVTAAPKQEQLLKQVWKEIGSLWGRFQVHFPQAQLLTGLIRMKPDDANKEAWSAVAFVAGVGADEEAATKAQGFHRPHMLFITEETPGMHPAIMTAFDQTRTDDHNLHLALGNPDHRQDPLHEFCMRESVVHVRISAFDHPNIVTGRSVVPGAIGVRRLAERTALLGIGSRLYESRLRGISPKESQDALILYAWCKAAAAKWADKELREGPLALGVDVAQWQNGDHAAISRWQGACCTEVVSFPVGEMEAVKDATQVGTDVWQEAFITGVSAKHIGVDPVGVGAAAVNELKRRGLKVRYLSGATRPIPGMDTELRWSETGVHVDGYITPKGPSVVEAERYNNHRSQIWWRMREDLRLGRVALPDDEELFKDLTTPKYTTMNGIIVVESKEQIVKNLRRSPDKGDACCYGNFVRQRSPVIIRKSTEVPKSTNLQDYGLERTLVVHDKHRRAENRSFQRTLRAFGRKKR